MIWVRCGLVVCSVLSVLCRCSILLVLEGRLILIWVFSVSVLVVCGWFSVLMMNLCIMCVVKVKNLCWVLGCRWVLCVRCR